MQLSVAEVPWTPPFESANNLHNGDSMWGVKMIKRLAMGVLSIIAALMAITVPATASASGATAPASALSASALSATASTCCTPGTDPGWD